MEETSSRSVRILVVDERTSFGLGLRKLLCDSAEPLSQNGSDAPDPTTPFRCDNVVDAKAAVLAIETAKSRNDPYDVAFVELGDSDQSLDARDALLGAAPHLKVVLYSDPSNPRWTRVRAEQHPGNRMWLLEHPIDSLQLRQLARTLAENARLSRENSERVAAMKEAELRLQEEIQRRIRTEMTLTHDALHDPLTLSLIHI